MKNSFKKNPSKHNSKFFKPDKFILASLLCRVCRSRSDVVSFLRKIILLMIKINVTHAKLFEDLSFF